MSSLLLWSWSQSIVLGEECVSLLFTSSSLIHSSTSFRVFSLPTELLETKEKVLIDISDDSDDEEEKIGFVQHLSATKM